MGHHHDCLPEVLHRPPHELENLVAGPAIEVSGRLVGEDDLGSGDECSGDSDALLLTARQFRWPVGEPVSQSDGLHDSIEPLLVRLAAGEEIGKGDVLQCREAGDEVVRLEDEADLVASELGELFVVEFGEVDVADESLS